MDEIANKKCALRLNAVIYDLQEQEHTDNSIANGLLFALCIHIINSRFSISEIIGQMIALHKDIKKEIGNLNEDVHVDLKSPPPVDPIWD